MRHASASPTTAEQALTAWIRSARVITILLDDSASHSGTRSPGHAKLMGLVFPGELRKSQSWRHHTLHAQSRVCFIDI